MKSTTPSYLKHHFLIAMPHMVDPNFAHTVIYLVEHNQHGAMGLVINRSSGLSLADVLEQLQPETEPDERCRHLPIYAGGPVHTDRGFVLHPRDWSYQATLELGELALSTSQDVLLAIADGSGPPRHLIALGYAGWEAGQLEQELMANAWLTAEACGRVVFDIPLEERWSAAAGLVGVDPRQLSGYAGHA